ncbi:MAG: hypothetical protein ACRECH_11455 [Nitrososphaerales archaeon]
MVSEAPLISRALRLVTFALIISTVALAASAGYSAYQEYNALASFGSTSSNFTQSFNGTTMTLSGLTIPNNMSYPLSLQLLGSIYLANSHIANFASPLELIQPGQSKQISLSVDLNFTKVLQNSAIFQAILFQPFHLDLNTTISASVIPIIGLNISKAVDQVYQPVIGSITPSLDLASARISSDNKSLLIPLDLNWYNSSPISFTGGLNATLTGVPSQPNGNYGSGSAPLTVSSGSNNNVVTLAIPRSGTLANQFMSGNYTRGTYTFALSLGAYGVTVPLQENVTL